MKIALYVRVSTQEQATEGYSVSAQISLLRQYCIGYQYEITKVYQDSGISGKNIKDRPGLCELIDDAKENKFDVVLVWKLSRLSRSLLDLLSVVDIFNNHNISFQSYSEKFDTSTPIGKMLLQLLGSIAEFERNTIIENVKMGMNERFRSGLPKAGVPFGYQYKDKKIVTIPDQAAAIKFVFDYYNNSTTLKSTTELVNYMNGQGFKTKLGNLWTPESIRHMLKNNFYAGYIKTGTTTHQRKGKDYQELMGTHEPIISKELFNSVNKKMDDLRRHPIMKYPDGNYILTGLIICPRCGKTMYGAQQYNHYIKKNGEKTKYLSTFYKCSSSSTVVQCKGFTFATKKIEQQVLDKIFTLNKTLLKKAIEKAKKSSNKSQKPTINKVKGIETELAEAYKIRDRYYKILDTGEFNEETINQFAKKLNEVLIKIDSLEKRKEVEIIQEESPTINFNIDEFIKMIKDFKDLFDNMTYEQKKRVLRGFIKEIRIDESINLLDIVTIEGINLV